MILLLNLININCSNLLSLSLHLMGVKTLPAILKSLSTGADDEGTLSSCLAIGTRVGKLAAFSDQYIAGFADMSTQGVLKYLSTSPFGPFAFSLFAASGSIKLNKDFVFFGAGSDSSCSESSEGVLYFLASSTRRSLYLDFSLSVHHLSLNLGSTTAASA